ncbi:MAG: 3D domain-containing protein [Oscillospiraceae bacterium]|jgi:3D (Asp-Asp-Asp) domain-containing protein|nr:3D domain-containing protein [Oscillospiraceae bacterium]
MNKKLNKMIIALAISLSFAVSADILMEARAFENDVISIVTELGTQDPENKRVNVLKSNGLSVTLQELEIEQTDEYLDGTIQKKKSRLAGTFKITAYCPCSKCCGIWAKNRPIGSNGNEVIMTASGQRAVPGRSAAVDTRVIPFGTKFLIDGKEYIAHDTGSAIRGNTIDLMFKTHEEALNFGRKYREVYIVS